MRAAQAPLSPNLGEPAAPLAVPHEQGERKKTKTGEDAPRYEWETFSVAWSREFLKIQITGKEPDAATSSWNQILAAWLKNDIKGFNTQVHDYRRLLAKSEIKELDLPKSDFEAWFNQARLFMHAKMLYLMAMIIVLLSWMPRLKFLRSTANALIIGTLLVHSVALISRIYISGRPPVTNLYSSAVFIGWGCVLLGWFLAAPMAIRLIIVLVVFIADPAWLDGAARVHWPEPTVKNLLAIVILLDRLVFPFIPGLRTWLGLAKA